MKDDHQQQLTQFAERLVGNIDEISPLYRKAIRPVVEQINRSLAAGFQANTV